MVVCIPYTNDEHEQNQWDYVLSNFKPDEIFILNPEEKELPKTNVFGKGRIIKSLEELKEYNIIFLAPEHGRYIQGKTNIFDLKHPENAAYVVGSNHVYPTTDNYFDKYIKHYVFIPTDTKDDMYNWVAMAIILYDRKLKMNG